MELEPKQKPNLSWISSAHAYILQLFNTSRHNIWNHSRRLNIWMFLHGFHYSTCFVGDFGVDSTVTIGRFGHKEGQLLERWDWLQHKTSSQATPGSDRYSPGRKPTERKPSSTKQLHLTDLDLPRVYWSSTTIDSSTIVPHTWTSIPGPGFSKPDNVNASLVKFFRSGDSRVIGPVEIHRQKSAKTFIFA